MEAFMRRTNIDELPLFNVWGNHVCDRASSTMLKHTEQYSELITIIWYDIMPNLEFWLGPGKRFSRWGD
jgi:hypothetical protein